MSLVVGIDLGTTNTVVAAARDGQATAIADESGRVLIPSIVSFHPDGSVLVGHEARARRRIDPTNTIYSVKRLIGRSWDSREVVEARKRFPFEMREGPGQAALVAARGETYTLPEISAFVLRKAKTVAERALGQPVDKAVITVPANFNDLQRAATKVAGRIAGLEVLRILNEPTAAALAYGHGRSASERLAVYDFGGGTFDITLLDLSNNVFEVLATAGNTFLGGDDIDLAIAEKMTAQLLAQTRFDAKVHPEAFERLRMAAEQVKHQLSTATTTTIDVDEVGHGPGGKPLHLRFTMTRPEFERCAEPIIQQTFDVCKEALGVARLTATDFARVLLVGGSTRIPLAKRRVETFFKQDAMSHLNPDEVVAIGAAIQAEALSTAAERRIRVPAPPPGLASAQRDSVPEVLALPAEGPWSLASATAPSTEPFGRPRTHTARGLDPDADAAAPARAHAIVVPPPQGAPPASARAAEAAPPATEEREFKRVTRTGLGPAPAGARTLTGLGSRGRQRTGPGLGPAATDTRDTGSAGDAPSPFEAAAAALGNQTLHSAADAAQAALQSAPPPNVEIKSTTPPAPSRSPSTAPATRLSREEFVRRYGSDLPLVMPDELGPPPERDPLRDIEDEETLVGAPTEPGPLDLDEDEETLARAPRFAPPSGRTLPRSAPPPSARAQPASAPPQAPSAPPQAAPPWQASSPAPHFAPPPQYAPPPPANPSPQAAQPPQALQPQYVAPVLVDVTPLTLSVETVGGYCDPVIARNTAVPCDRSRDFATATDNQTLVSVRISQGESRRFSENTLLGEVHLTGLRPGPRGSVKITVRFSLDVSGMLNVSAQDAATGQAAHVQLKLVGLPELGNLDQMMARHAAHPEAR